jgi:sulfatase modifying factor 1
MRTRVTVMLAAALLQVHCGEPAPPAVDSVAASGSSSLGGPEAGARREILGIAFRWCPPGSFTMGSPRRELDRRGDEEQVEVTLTRGFWMSELEVTQGQWRQVIGDFPAAQPAGESDEHPVVEVSYVDVEGFCLRATALAREANELPRDIEIRLPTEAEWEYACRAGTPTATSFGESLGSTQANMRGDSPYGGAPIGPSRGRAAPVGSYPANPWGLRDMHGNAFEWCRDWYHARLPGGVDPDLSETPGTANRDGTWSRVRRGGAFNDEGKYCRSAMRLRYEPERRSDHIGFRIVAAPRTE